MQELREIKNRKILLDSSILIAYAHDGFQERSGNPLRTLYENKNELAVTNFQGFEVLKNESRSGQQEKYLKFLNFFPHIALKQDYFQNAALLCREYLRVRSMNDIGAVDLIMGGLIAAHASNDKVLLFTTNRKHFCEPFWNTISRVLVPHEKDGTKIDQILYLLEFDPTV